MQANTAPGVTWHVHDSELSVTKVDHIPYKWEQFIDEFEL
jgi:hypothetical protein